MSSLSNAAFTHVYVEHAVGQAKASTPHSCTHREVGLGGVCADTSGVQSCASPGWLPVSTQNLPNLWHCSDSAHLVREALFLGKSGARAKSSGEGAR